MLALGNPYWRDDPGQLSSMIDNITKKDNQVSGTSEGSALHEVALTLPQAEWISNQAYISNDQFTGNTKDRETW